MQLRSLQGEKTTLENQLQPTPWLECRLEHCAEAIDPQPSHRTPPIDINGIPYIGLQDFDKETGRIDFENARRVPSCVLEEHKQRYALSTGDFILGKIGTVGGAFRIPAERFFALSANVVLVRPRDSVADATFLFYVMKSPFVERQYNLNTNATTQSAFGIKTVRQILIHLPPLPEQALIAAALSDVDALIASLDGLIAKKRHIKQGAMQQLLTGRSRLPGFTKTWKTGKIADAITSLEAGVSVKSVDLGVHTHNLHVLKTSAVVGGKFRPSECKPIAPVDFNRAKCHPRANTILISRMNTPDLVGECGYVPETQSNLFLPDRLWMASMANGISAHWLSYVLASEPYKLKLKEIASGTSGSMKNISKAAFRSLELLIPTRDEQTAIAHVLGAMDDEISALESRGNKTQLIKQGIMQQLLTGRIRLV